MLSLIASLAIAAVQAAPAPAITPIATTSLKDIPGVTVTYFDVPGKDGKAIQKNLQKLRTDRATKQFNATSSNWNVAATNRQARTGDQCVIKAVEPVFTGTVELPRLATPDAVPADVRTQWQTYVDGLDKTIAENFLFVRNQLPTLVASMVGKDCKESGTLWNGGIQKIKNDAIARSAAAASAAPAAK